MNPADDPNLGFDPEALEVLGDDSPEKGDSLDFNTDVQDAVRAYTSMRSAAYKTVETFASITKRRLWLRDSVATGTDGNEIRAPFKDPEFYRLVESQLAHILFRTDPTAKRIFVSEYALKVEQLAKQRGVSIPQSVFAPILSTIITLLERTRVQSLWGMLYAGSYDILKTLQSKEVDPLCAEAHRDLLTFLTCVTSAPDKIESGALDRFQPCVEEALRKVQRRGPTATLAVSKWLVMQLVNEIIREKKALPPPTPPKKREQDDDEEEEGGGAGSSDWNPPPPDATADEKTQALKDLVNRASRDAPPAARESVTENKFQQKRGNPKSAATANAGLNAPVNQEEEFEQQLSDSEGEMEDLVDQARAAMRQQFREDDWLVKNAAAKIVFIDESLVPLEHLPPEDAQTVQRLRALFHRVMGRRKSLLADSGIEVDVQALIERKLTGAPIPIYKEEGRGRGFCAHILIDLSGSMTGDKLVQCSRATAIITRALKYPFVSFSVWGFSSHTPGEVKITRFDAKGEIVLSMKMQGAGGGTPLHIATRVVTRKLMDSQEDKQLFILTDGMPSHQRQDGRHFSTRQLLLLEREEIRKARKDGINVTGVLLGARHPQSGIVEYDLEDRDLFFVFGGRRNWKKLAPESIGNDLVQVITTSFLEFLKRR